jgi:Rod binding domain-containing protein
VTKAIETGGADLAAWAARPEAVPVAKAAEAFEAMLLQQILETAQEPLFENSLLGGGPGGSLYRSLFAQEVAARMAARGGFGLARAVAGELAAAGATEETP